MHAIAEKYMKLRRLAASQRDNFKPSKRNHPSAWSFFNSVVEDIDAILHLMQSEVTDKDLRDIVADYDTIWGDTSKALLKSTALHKFEKEQY